MRTATLTLTDFLLARITEDEEAARAAAERDPAPWTPGRSAGGDEDDGLYNATSRERTLPAWGDRPERTIVELDPVFTFDSGYGGAAFGWAESVAHIARWDPARVLAECQAKRRIVASCINVIEDRDGYFATLDVPEGRAISENHLRLLALPYADHPDYNPEWRA